MELVPRLSPLARREPGAPTVSRTASFSNLTAFETQAEFPVMEIQLAFPFLSSSRSFILACFGRYDGLALY